MSPNLIGRPMDDQERTVIAHLLAVSFNGAAELREQLAVARVARDWKPEGSASLISPFQRMREQLRLVTA